MSLDHAMSLDFDEAMSMSMSMSMPFDNGMSMPFDDGMSMPFDDGMSMPHDETMSLDLTMSMPDSTNAEPADVMPAHIAFEEDPSNLALEASNPALDTFALTSESNALASERLPATQTAMIVVVSMAVASIAFVVVQRKFAKNKICDDNSVALVEPMTNPVHGTASLTGFHV